MLMRWLAVPALFVALGSSAWAADCPSLLQGSLPKLHAKESIDLCQRFAGKPLIVVNTASFCGFAPQFKGLEALYQRYKEQGLEVLGVPSNDFKQEAKDGAETAKGLLRQLRRDLHHERAAESPGPGRRAPVQGSGRTEQRAEMEFLQVRGRPPGAGDCQLFQLDQTRQPGVDQGGGKSPGIEILSTHSLPNKKPACAGFLLGLKLRDLQDVRTCRWRPGRSPMRCSGR